MKTFVFFLLLVLAIYQVACMGDNQECLRKLKTQDNGMYSCQFGCAANRYGDRDTNDGFPGFPVVHTLQRQDGLSTRPAPNAEKRVDKAFISRNKQKSPYFEYNENSDLLKDAPRVMNLCPDSKGGCLIYDFTLYRIDPANVFSAGNNGGKGQVQANKRAFKVWSEQPVEDQDQFRWALLTVEEPTNEGELCESYFVELNYVPFYNRQRCYRDIAEREEEEPLSPCEKEFCDNNFFQPSPEDRGGRKQDCVCLDDINVFDNAAITYLVVGYKYPEDHCERTEFKTTEPRKTLAPNKRAIDTTTTTGPVKTEPVCYVEKADVEFHFAYTKLGPNQAFGCSVEDE